MRWGRDERDEIMRGWTFVPYETPEEQESTWLLVLSTLGLVFALGLLFFAIGGKGSW